MKQKSSRGFTIVELLVVIVVIGILAAITIVSYAGITARANTTKALSNANSVQTVADVFNADKGYYPSAISDFSTANLAAKLPTGITIQGTAIGAATNTIVRYEYCGVAATPTAANVLGGRISYYNYSEQDSDNYVYVGSGSASLGGNCAQWNNAS